MNEAEDHALRALLAALKARGYRFVTPTPATHARVIARPEHALAADLRGVFGWSRPFPADLLDADLLATLASAGLLEAGAGRTFRSEVRVSSLGEDLLVHSAFPTEAEDAVFFGPDSYRFAALIETELSRIDRVGVRTVIDIGTGTGVGAVTAARLCPNAAVIGTDVNPRALRYAAVNAAAAGVRLAACLSPTLGPLAGAFDLILANPPYIVDPADRAYRQGGGMHGAEVALDMARDALDRLAEGGTFILYSGAAIVDGADRLRAELAALARASGCALRYRELDPDVFGEELSEPGYREVERIALIAAVATRDRGR